MGRNWQPKYKVLCMNCGWKGKRTTSTFHYKCPKCGGYPVHNLIKKKGKVKITDSVTILYGKVSCPDCKEEYHVDSTGKDEILCVNCRKIFTIDWDNAE